MPFWRCFYHVVWTTKHRAPIISPEHEAVIFEVIRSKTAELGGEVLAVNGVADHVHVAVTIPPSLAVAVWVKRMKGGSARMVNLNMPDAGDHFSWQDGYGVLTFGAKQLDTVMGYIQRQKEHHAANTLMAYLEQVE